MTYASINEAWGGISGSNQLTTPLERKRHPLHQKQIERRRQPPPPLRTTQDPYQCNYADHTCEQVFQQNQQYNNQKKEIAQGTQPFLMQSPHPQDYTFLPQYPWNEWARYGYLMYGPQVSNMWYSNPYQFNPQVAQQIRHQQIHGNVGPMTPIGPYYPQGFTPMGPEYNVNPPSITKKRREDFTNDAKTIKTGMIYFIFFLLSLAVILCIFMMFLVCKQN